jgi:hypothetical protein
MIYARAIKVSQDRKKTNDLCGLTWTFQVYLGAGQKACLPTPLNVKATLKRHGIFWLYDTLSFVGSSSQWQSQESEIILRWSERVI